MKRTACSLISERAPGETGVRFELSEYRRPLIVSFDNANEVYVTVGCHVVKFTVEEALAIAEELIRVAEEARPDGRA